MQFLLKKYYIAIYLLEKMEFGKKEIAIEFSRCILSGEENSNEFDINNHPDFNIIQSEGNSIKIEQIRMIQNKINEKPIISNRKVYIINDSEYMTKEAQNCLLKTLEEPPEYATLILICSNENLLLSTIKSRCTKVFFEDISKEDIKSYLQKNNLCSNISDTILEASNGSIGKACQIIEKQELFENANLLIENIDKCDKIDYINNLKFLYNAKEDIFSILEYANIILLSKLQQDSRYINCIKYIENAKNKLIKNANFDMTIDDLLFHLWEEINENNNRS